MRLIFIRHGDPDYAKDSLTPKGFREAALLSDRMKELDVTEFYCSPLGRAMDTARVSLKDTGRTFRILDWLQEFMTPIEDPITNTKKHAWDFFPSYWTTIPTLYDKDKWFTSDVMKTGEIHQNYGLVISGIDSILFEHGYKRSGNIYRAEKSNTDTLVFYCHLGTEFVILSHLLGLSPVILWQNFYVAPTSVTEVITEERIQGEACFRCAMVGDTSHLYKAGEPKSSAGFFKEVF